MKLESLCTLHAGNTYKVQCEKLIPKVSFDPSNLQLFFPVHLTSSKPIFRTFTITNQTTEPLLFCMQLLEGQNVVGNAYRLAPSIVTSTANHSNLLKSLSYQIVPFQSLIPNHSHPCTHPFNLDLPYSSFTTSPHYNTSFFK